VFVYVFFGVYVSVHLLYSDHIADRESRRPTVAKNHKKIAKN